VSGSPYFFLAYAHTPERVWVNKLYRALSEEIVERTEWPPDRPPGFMDENGIRVGEDWRQAVAGALANCRVLVPLYSRRYFTRPECGREWHAFHDRMIRHRIAHGERITPIVPVLWTPVPDRHIPESVRHVQVDFETVDYAEDGLYTLIKNSAYRTKYLRVVRHLAEQIILAAEAHPPFRPCDVGELDLTSNSFQQTRENTPVNRRLTIMVAAPTVYELPAERAEKPYGATALGWRPFDSGSTAPVAELAAALARSLGYEPEAVSVEHGLSMDWSSPATGLGVVLVDPWWCVEGSRSGWITQIDQLGQGRIGAAVIWNEKDQQTEHAMDDLRKSLQAAAPRVLGERGAPTALGAVQVHNQNQFAVQFPALLDRIFNRYLNLAQAQPPPGSSGSRPYLTGPKSGPAPQGPEPTGGRHGH
jgi:FxsC-like protein